MLGFGGRQRLLGLGELDGCRLAATRRGFGLQPLALTPAGQPRQAVARVLAEAVLAGEVALELREPLGQFLGALPGAPVLCLDFV